MNAAFATVGLYAGFCALILLWLTASTIKLRARYKVSIGDGDNKHLRRVMRGHANAVENMSIVLIMMLVMAGLGTPNYVLHGFGLVLVAARALHAHHFIQEDAPRWTRYYPSVASVFLLLGGGIGVIGHSLFILAK